ncbi:MAG: gamma-glutamyl-gamma-aminobutyrate hydrolase family protein [Aquabacterium sp.]|uniref:gamma-glutamyl-gamma-aminobutyrate hydrolase family protein n=1 Tax=Aquabacterium sp. TaxID=1872578 RepID=UPI00120F922C|nr:gamma-glutamyl-gamma-aminobutyrate hydrolase family protein [Aquabacterium sp.]TAK84222.1 MAG: gamma-glutamyl-gamma-aminobutyrate hydrolase family protein [Aquabacterium sp.]
MSANQIHPPLVLVPACQRILGRHPFHVAGKKYIDAVRMAGCVPLVVPAAQADELPALLDLASGILLTGSPSNVHPSHFGEDVLDESLPLDPERDAWTLPMIRLALRRGMPLLGICRGFQEVNVALGGSLHQAVHAEPDLMDHRGDSSKPVDEEYGLAHPVKLIHGGLLDKALQSMAEPVIQGGEFMVNSLHGQGVKRLADGARIEALAPDGVVEAFSWHPMSDDTESVRGGFNLCLQWHPEWQAASNPVSQRIFKAFGSACAAYQSVRLSPSGASPDYVERVPHPERR